MDLQDVIREESNSWFERNRSFFEASNNVPQSSIIISDFINNYNKEYNSPIKALLEIGCCYGYNLDYFSNLNLDCYGIDSSDKAIKFGCNKYSSDIIHLTHGFSDSLKFEDAFFDFVIVGFSLYITPREMILKSISEIDRVLKYCGFVAITDFDTPFKMMRNNVHNSELPVFKDDYSDLFINNGYSLIEKRTYSHDNNIFTPDIQERVSTQILYKERIEDTYIKQ